MLGKEVVVKDAVIVDMYDKVQQIRSIIQKQKMLIIDSKEFGKICFSTKSKWAKTLSIKDRIDVQVTLNEVGKKDIILAKRPKLLKVY